MKKLAVLIIIFQCCTNLSAQKTIEIDTNSNFFKYYIHINQAENDQLNGNFILADSLYKLAFSCIERPFKHDYSSAFSNSVHFNKTLALSYLKKGINLGIHKKELKNISGFGNLSKLDQKTCFQEYRELEISRNDSLYKVVKEMVRRDQRKARAFWTNWLSWEKQVKIMDKVDRPNAAQLLDICSKNGWPGISALGENTANKYRAEGTSLLTLHFSKEELINLQPYMVKAIENGEMHPYQLARAIDYLYMAETTDSSGWKIMEIQQIYGTMYSNDEIIPFGELKTVNNNRKLIGLEPIEEYAKKRNLNLPNQHSIIYREKLSLNN
jgi:hypothetical protein